MPTQIRHCKKKLFSYHQAGNLKAAANLHCTATHNRSGAKLSHVPYHRHLTLSLSSYSLYSESYIGPGHLMSRILCLPSSISFLILPYKCPSRGLTRASSYTQVQVYTCQLPSLPPNYFLLLFSCYLIRTVTSHTWLFTLQFTTI